jgi:hypothetical protein
METFIGSNLASIAMSCQCGFKIGAACPPMAPQGATPRLWVRHRSILAMHQNLFYNGLTLNSGWVTN